MSMHNVATALTVLQLAIAPDAIPLEVSLPDIAREVQAVWTPLLQVVVDTIEAPLRAGAIRLTVRAHDAATGGAAPDDAALGSVRFVDGQPQPVITVSPRRARAVVNRAVVSGRLVSELPASVGQRLLATVLGRAIAHEVGHYLLASPTHARAGLMRAALGLRDLTEPGTARLRLSRSEHEQVARRLAGQGAGGAPARASRARSSASSTARSDPAALDRLWP